MLVIAKCVSQCWDSTRCVMYYPGFEYEIDTDSPLVNMKTAPEAGRPQYAFQFDRTGLAKPKIQTITRTA